MNLSPRFSEALSYACEIHQGQIRKGTAIPYIAHLLGVTGIALEYGADEDQAIAALLHDAAEDAGGEPRLQDIRRRFGQRVADYVRACTDTVESPKPPWRERKEAYIAHIASADPAALLISAADKLHNARNILKDFRATGDAVWSRFNGGKDGTLWYYRALVVAFRKVIPSDLVEELDRVVSEIERLARCTCT